MKLLDPNQVVRDIVELYAETAARQDVELVHELDETLQPAPLDPEGIEACLTNLMSNAIDAVMMREEGPKRVVMRTLERDDELVFQVEDNGAGMDQGSQEQNFHHLLHHQGRQGHRAGPADHEENCAGAWRTDRDEYPNGCRLNLHHPFPRKRLQTLYQEQNIES